MNTKLPLFSLAVNQQLNVLMTICIISYALIILAPYFAWNMPVTLTRAVALLAILSSIIYLAKSNIVKKNGYLFLTLYFIFLTLEFFEGYAVNFSIILFLIFVLLRNDDKIKIFEAFGKIYALLLIPSIFLAVEFYLFGFRQGQIIEPPDSKGEYGLYYYAYSGAVILSNQIADFGGSAFFRLSGVFNEPGVIGTISALYMWVYRRKLNWWTLISILGGVLSFSAFFYLVLVLYVITLACTKLIYFLIFMLLTIFIPALYGSLSGEFFEQFINYRINRLLSGDLSGFDNRTRSCFWVYWDSFIKSQSVYFGMGHEPAGGCSSITPLRHIYSIGIIGFSLLVTIYIAVTLFLLRKKVLFSQVLFIIVSSLALYQRPYFDAIWMLIIFTGGLLVIAKTRSFSKTNPSS